MQISTKYEIGHRYWVPRTRCETKEEQQEINGELWFRETFKWTAYAKEKKIIDISVIISADNKTKICYHCINISDELEYPTIIDESDINNYTQEEAIGIAEELAEQGEHCYSY